MALEINKQGIMKASPLSQASDTYLTAYNNLPHLSTFNTSEFICILSH